MMTSRSDRTIERMAYRTGDIVYLSMSWVTPPLVAGAVGVVLPYGQKARVVGHLEQGDITVQFLDLPPTWHPDTGYTSWRNWRILHDRKFFVPDYALMHAPPPR